jgi:hypothetical protein
MQPKKTTTNATRQIAFQSASWQGENLLIALSLTNPWQALA